jgi:phosphoribosylformylglycinamidine synthase subunit PurQ / glutaminase
VTPRVGVVVFPGANDDRDAAHALRLVGAEPVMVWHAERSLEGLDAVILPGGFSYGDYLRCGAIAARSPAVAALRDHVARGRPVLGICNGFQVLTEAGLLPGALRPNTGLRFRCEDARLVACTESPWLPGVAPGDDLTIPIKHHDGCFVAEEGELARLEAEGRILLRYASNPNGSLRDIAAVSDERGLVVGLMPHPEHAVDALIGSSDGRRLLDGLLQLAAAPVTA